MNDQILIEQCWHRNKEKKALGDDPVATSQNTRGWPCVTAFCASQGRPWAASKRKNCHLGPVGRPYVALMRPRTRPLGAASVASWRQSLGGTSSVYCSTIPSTCLSSIWYFFSLSNITFLIKLSFGPLLIFGEVVKSSFGPLSIFGPIVLIQRQIKY